MNYLELKRTLKQSIEQDVLVADSAEDADSWLYDFRQILLHGQTADLIAEIFYHDYAEAYPFQLGAMESAGLPLLTTLMNKLYARGHNDINAFFLRKSRKKSGRCKIIEGKLKDEPQKIILVDDIINSGTSLWQQVEVLQEEGRQVDTIWTIMRFRDLSYYKQFTDRGITISSLFCLDDFAGKSNLTESPQTMLPMPYDINWVFRARNPNYELVCPKSQPVYDLDTIYVGSDAGRLYAIDQVSGKEKWSYAIAQHKEGKGILSGPQLYNNMVICGGYDGVLYALNKDTGKVIWKNITADWIGSTPAINEEAGIVYCGVEFGLPKQAGGVIAVSAQTGETLWLDKSHQALTHASPLFLAPRNEVVIGSNEGIVYMYDALTGELKWQSPPEQSERYSWAHNQGFGRNSIKGAIAYDEEHDYLFITRIDGTLSVLERGSGKVIHTEQAEFACINTPLVYQGFVYWTSLDKRLRCLDIASLSLTWELNLDHTRLFSKPAVIENRLYVGTNGGRLYELDPHTGEKIAYLQTRERLTNAPIYNPTSQQFFLPTLANEIIAFHRQSPDIDS